MSVRESAGPSLVPASPSAAPSAATPRQLIQERTYQVLDSWLNHQANLEDKDLIVRIVDGKIVKVFEKNRSFLNKIEAYLCNFRDFFLCIDSRYGVIRGEVKQGTKLRRHLVKLYQKLRSRLAPNEQSFSRSRADSHSSAHQPAGAAAVLSSSDEQPAAVPSPLTSTSRSSGAETPPTNNQINLPKWDRLLALFPHKKDRAVLNQLRSTLNFEADSESFDRELDRVVTKVYIARNDRILERLQQRVEQRLFDFIRPHVELEIRDRNDFGIHLGSLIDSAKANFARNNDILIRFYAEFDLKGLKHKIEPHREAIDALNKYLPESEFQCLLNQYVPVDESQEEPAPAAASAAPRPALKPVTESVGAFRMPEVRDAHFSPPNISQMNTAIWNELIGSLNPETVAVLTALKEDGTISLDQNHGDFKLYIQTKLNDRTEAIRQAAEEKFRAEQMNIARKVGYLGRR